MIFSCNKEDDDTNKEDGKAKTEFNVNLDPTDYSIATIFSPDGDSIYVYGEKDTNGQPIQMSNVVITPHDSEGATEIQFNADGNPQKVIAPNGVVMLFNWVDKQKAALTLIDPNTEEQLNTVLDFNQTTTKSNTTAKVAEHFDKRAGKTIMSVSPLKTVSKGKQATTRSTKNLTGSLTIRQCGVETNAECWVDAYSYDGMPYSGLGKHVGRLKCVNKGDGTYQYVLPQGVTGEHHDLSEHCNDIMNVLTGICEISNTLGPAYKEAICTQITAALATGVVSVGVALGFEAACTALNYSLEIFCHTTGMEAAMWGNGYSGADALCDVIKEMHLEWDDPLLFVPTVNALPSYITGIPKQWDGTSALPDLEVSWGGQPQISQFILEPAAPAHGQSYEAMADLYCLPAGAIITLSIVGTDGYSDTKVFVVGNEINYQAILHVPGASTGVKDVCTIKLELPDGSIKTKKASLVFQ